MGKGGSYLNLKCLDWGLVLEGRLHKLGVPTGWPSLAAVLCAVPGRGGLYRMPRRRGPRAYDRCSADVHWLC